VRLPGFCGPTYQSQSPVIDPEDAIGLYCEKSESAGAKVPIAMLMVPGKQIFATVPENSVPDVFTVNGRSFAAASNFYELLGGNNVANRGSLGAIPLTPTQIIANQGQLLILNNGNLYVFTLATNVLVAVNMAQFNGPVAQIDFADGYGIATIQNSNTWQQSNLEDFTTWNGLNIATISLFPDNITSMKVDHREIVFFSGKKSQPYYNAGAGFPVFIPIQGALIENGAGASFATVQMDNTVFWIDQSERGGRVARRLNGYASQRVSTHAVELAWSQYPTVADAAAYTYELNGHAFWVIRFPSANNGQGATWVYDAATQFWHKRAFWTTVSGTYSADRSTSHTFNFGAHLVGDWASGNIYAMSDAYVTDFGNPIRWQRTTPLLGKELQWVDYEEIEFDVEVGTAPQPPLKDGNGQPRPAQIMLQWSNDGVLSNTYTLSLGFAGQFLKRVLKRMLGRSRRRYFIVSGTDPVRIRFADAYLRATPEVEAQNQ
jgi:hypothetical protein